MELFAYAKKAATQLAKLDTAQYFYEGTSCRVSEEEVMRAIEEGVSLKYLFSPVATIDDDIKRKYQERYDYYFSILTNL